jgi:Na+-driven multidrug efflux pump
VAKYNGFAVLPALALHTAISTMVAQNIGAGKEDRAIKTCLTGMGISYLISFVIFILTIIFPHQILRMFSSDVEMIRIGVPYLRAVTFDYMLMPAVFSLMGFFIGTGHTTFTLISNIMSAIVIRVPVAYLFSMVLGLGLPGIGYAGPAASSCILLIELWFFFSGRWKVKTVHIEE